MSEDKCRECKIKITPSNSKSSAWLMCDNCYRDRHTEETRTYSVKGSIRHLNELEKLFGCMDSLGSMGSSCDIDIFYDGDGAAHMEFKRTDKSTTLIEDESEKIEMDEDGTEELEYSFE